MTAQPALQIMPDWPARLSEEMAALYLGGISQTTFREGVKSGRYPGPVKDGKRVFWSRRQLDHYVDAQFGLGPAANSWDDL